MNHAKVLLDVKGLIMHSFWRCEDRDSTIFNAEGKKIARATAAFETFLTSYLLPIFEDHAPKDVIVVWDGGNARRRALFEDYKKTRREKEKDPIVEQQLDLLYKYVKTFMAGLGAVQVQVPKAEADDVVAYLCQNLAPYCVIHTVDHDLIQLSGPTCLVMVKNDPMDNSHGVPAGLIPLHKSIVGDSSDGYPGVKGAGPKAWDSLVEAFGIDGMEELAAIAAAKSHRDFADVAQHNPHKVLEKMYEQRYDWFTMYELARLHPEWCEGEYAGKQLIKPEWFKRLPDRGRVVDILTKTGCADLLGKVERFLPVTILVTADNVDDVIYNGTFIDDLNDSIVAFDYETDDINRFPNFVEAANGKNFVDVLSSRITGASFTWGANLNKTIYISVNHKDTANCSKQVILDILREAEHVVVQNASFERAVSILEFGENAANEALGVPIDTKILSSYVDENSPSGLKDNSASWLNYHQTTYKAVVGDRAGMSELTGEEVLQYGSDDAICTAHLWSLFDLIMQVEQTKEFCYENEFITDSVFTDSFIKGCRVDLARLAAFEKRDQAELDRLWPELRDLLADNCRTHNDAAANAYMTATREFIIASMRAAGKSDDDIQAKVSSEMRRLWEATIYTPYSVTHVPFEFKPTVNQINSVLERLGIPKPEKDSSDKTPYLLKSVALSRITEWAFTLRGLAATDPLVTSEVLHFLDLVTSAAHQFKTREGDEYRGLEDYVGKLFVDKAKTVTEGDELNFDSPKQMAEILYCKLALPIRHYSKVNKGSTRDELGFAGGPSTNDKAIEIALAEDCRADDDWRRQVLLLIREIKHLQTKFKFYYKPYPLWVRPDDGKIHPGIINCGTVTRRPSGTSPNILQVQKGELRSVYLPMEPGHILIAPDFSGQELRIMGSESNDPVLLEAYLGEVEKCIHSLTASAILPKIAKKVNPEVFAQIEYIPGKPAQTYDQFMSWRREEGELGTFSNWVRNKRAKGCNFLAAYEGGAGTLSTNLLVPREEAQEFLDGMFAMYVGIPKFQEESHQLGRKHGYVKTAYGNRRHMTVDILSRDDGLRMRMERQASNYRIQGCAADILKKVVADCWRSNLFKDTKSYLMAPVYDELVCSVPVQHAVEFCQRLQKIMNIAPPGHAIPMVSEFAIGFDWYNMVEIGRDTSETTVKKAITEAIEMFDKAEQSFAEMRGAA